MRSAQAREGGPCSTRLRHGCDGPQVAGRVVPDPAAFGRARDQCDSSATSPHAHAWPSPTAPRPHKLGRAASIRHWSAVWSGDSLARASTPLAPPRILPFGIIYIGIIDPRLEPRADTCAREGREWSHAWKRQAGGAAAPEGCASERWGVWAEARGHRPVRARGPGSAPAWRRRATPASGAGGGAGRARARQSEPCSALGGPPAPRARGLALCTPGRPWVGPPERGDSG